MTLNLFALTQLNTVSFTCLKSKLYSSVCRPNGDQQVNTMIIESIKGSIPLMLNKTTKILKTNAEFIVRP